MKLALAIQTPEVPRPVPVALLSGTFEEKLEKAAALGYNGVELMTVDPAALDAAALGASVENVGLGVAAVGSGAVALIGKLTLLNADPAVSQAAWDRLKAMIDFAAGVESPLVTIGSFRGWLKWIGGGEAARSQLVTLLYQGAEFAKLRGVRLAIEPLNRYESDVVANADDGLALIRQVSHPAFGLLLDTYHMNIEEADIIDSLRRALTACKLWHVHLGDSNRLAPGCGHLDFGDIVAELQAGGYHGYLSAELLAEPDPDTAARLTIEHMRRFVPVPAQEATS